MPSYNASGLTTFHAAERVIADVFVAVRSIDKQKINLSHKRGEVESRTVPKKGMYSLRLNGSFEKHFSDRRVSCDKRLIYFSGRELRSRCGW